MTKRPSDRMDVKKVKAGDVVVVVAAAVSSNINIVVAFDT